MCFLEDGGISAFGVHDDLIAILNVFDNYTHSSPATEGKNVDQLISILRVEDLQLNDVLCLFDEFVSHFAGKVNEANLIRTRSLVLLFLDVTDNIVAYDHSYHKFMELWLWAEGLNVRLNQFARIDLVLDRNGTKNHLIRGESTSFISKNTVNKS